MKDRVWIYVHVRQTGRPDGVDSQVRTSKAHKIRLLGEEAVFEQPPGSEQTDTDYNTAYI